MATPIPVSHPHLPPAARVVFIVDEIAPALHAALLEAIERGEVRLATLIVPPPDPAPGDDDPVRAETLAALARCHGNQTRAARLLGIARSTLVKRLDAYGTPRPQKHG